MCPSLPRTGDPRISAWSSFKRRNLSDTLSLLLNTHALTFQRACDLCTHALTLCTHALHSRSRALHSHSLVLLSRDALFRHLFLVTSKQCLNASTPVHSVTIITIYPNNRTSRSQKIHIPMESPP